MSRVQAAIPGNTDALIGGAFQNLESGTLITFDEVPANFEAGVSRIVVDQYDFVGMFEMLTGNTLKTRSEKRRHVIYRHNDGEHQLVV